MQIGFFLFFYGGSEEKYGLKLKAHLQKLNEKHGKSDNILRTLQHKTLWEKNIRDDKGWTSLMFMLFTWARLFGFYFWWINEHTVVAQWLEYVNSCRKSTETSFRKNRKYVWTQVNFAVMFDFLFLQ